jgi:hypothetical protein
LRLAQVGASRDDDCPIFPTSVKAQGFLERVIVARESDRLQVFFRVNPRRISLSIFSPPQVPSSNGRDLGR